MIFFGSFDLFCNELYQQGIIMMNILEMKILKEFIMKFKILLNARII